MQHAHGGNANFAGIPDLFAQSCIAISNLEATMSLLLLLRTSLLDLAERKLGLFFASGQQAVAPLAQKNGIGRRGRKLDGARIGLKRLCGPAVA